MRAVVFRRYGDPKQVMEVVAEREVPEPRESEALVRVECSTVNAADRYMVRADYLIVRLILGLFRPAAKNRVLGMDLSGTVHAVGREVNGLQVGDAVAADIRRSLGGGFAEYAIVRAADLVKLPAEVSFEDAATVPISGQAALMGLILCKIRPGDKVLINGASGGVGSFAIQIAKALGAHVTAMCSAAKAGAVKNWGADAIVDREKTGVADLSKNTFDAVFDAACFGDPGAFGEALKGDGRYVLVGGNYYNMLRVKLFGRWYARGNQQFRTVTQEVEITENISKVLEMMTQGEVSAPVQDTVSLSGVPGAIQRLEQRSVVGKIVVRNQQ